MLLHCDFQGIWEVGITLLSSWDKLTLLDFKNTPSPYCLCFYWSRFTASIINSLYEKKYSKLWAVEKLQIDKFKSSYESLSNYDTLPEHNDLLLFRLHWKNVEEDLMLNVRKQKCERKNYKQHKFCEQQLRKVRKAHRCEHLHCLPYVLHMSGARGLPKIVQSPSRMCSANIQLFQVPFEII